MRTAVDATLDAVSATLPHLAADDATSPAARTDRRDLQLRAMELLPAYDASIGGSILLGPRQHPDKRTVRFWLTPEIGYAYTTNAPIRPNPGRAEKDLLGSDENTQLGKLALSGIFWRASVGTTF